ncbi:MAG: hypothetical protein PHC43_05595, partial [Candidatus Marinimicrobia bacterium]|nr:hypothetical protein [Candidatus Neomarinimicrobiota bacterium]
MRLCKNYEYSIPRRGIYDGSTLINKVLTWEIIFNCLKISRLGLNILNSDCSLLRRFGMSHVEVPEAEALLDKEIKV